MNRLLLYQMKMGHQFNTIPSVNFLRGQFRKYYRQRIEFEVGGNILVNGDPSLPAYINAVFVGIIKTPEIKLLLKKIVIKQGKQVVKTRFDINFPITKIVRFIDKKETDRVVNRIDLVGFKAMSVPRL